VFATREINALNAVHNNPLHMEPRAARVLKSVLKSTSLAAARFVLTLGDFGKC
jgi:hypothetical protein